MHRLPLALARFLFVVVIGLLATALGTLLALGGTLPGRQLLARVFTDQSARLVRGSISIRRIEGNFFTWLNLDSVVVRDTTGFPLASLGRVEAQFRLPDLLAGRIVFNRILVLRPRLYLVKHRDGRLNLEEVLRLGEGPPGTGPGSLVELSDLRIKDGIVTVRTPWSPPGHLTTDAQRDSALYNQRNTWGKRIEEGGPEGLQQIRTVEGLQAHFDRLQLATPDRQPILAEVDSLSFLLNDPLLELRALAGEIRQARDTLWFQLNRVALPGTLGNARGLVSWPQDTLLFDFNFNAPRVALADLRFVSPDFPDLTGKGRLRAQSRGGLLTEYDIRELDVGDTTQRITGRLIALTHKFRGLGFRGLDLALQNLDMEVVRPFLDTLPFRGRVSGRLEADGYFADMRVGVDWTFFDDRIEGRPPNHVMLRGPVSIGGTEGMVFHQVQVDSMDLDLPTVRLAVPSMILEGRAAGVGTLDGPWRNVTFTGRIIHHDVARPVSAAEGRIRIDTRAEMVAMDADLTLMPLEFEGVRRTFPMLTALGSLSGPVRLLGPLDSMYVWANLQGTLGQVRAEGVLTMLPPRWAADSLVLDFTDLDLAQARGQGPPTKLAGHMVLAGTVDSAVAPEGRVSLDLKHSWIREVEVDSLLARAAVHDSVITVDTAQAHFPRVEVRASGSLGWVKPHGGTLEVTVSAERLLVFDSLLTTLAGLEPDTSAQPEPFDGRLDLKLTLQGALDSLEASASGSATDLSWRGIRLPTVDGMVTLIRRPGPQFQIQVRADTVLTNTLQFSGLEAHASGPADSLQWDLKGAGGSQINVDAAGTLDRRSGTRLGVTKLDLRIRENVWVPAAPFAITIADSVWSFPDVRLETRDGSAQLRLDGTLPARGPGELDLMVSGLELRDIYGLLQRDTSQVRGILMMDLRVAGTAADPVIRGTGNLTGPVFGDFRAPLTRIALNYQRHRLDANLTLWRTGMSLLDVGATLPLDLAWRRERRGKRQLPGQLAIRAKADSMNLAVVEALSRNLRQVRGYLTADVAVQGTWDEPRLGGTVAIDQGTALVPNLGVRYGPLDGRIHLSGDSLIIDTLEIGGREGRMVATGHLQLENLTRPVLGLDVRAFNFMVLDVPDYLRIQADGNLQLRGPLMNATMTGSATLRNSVIYFADLVTKSIVNLEDPLYADLVDTEAIRRRGLGTAFQSRFLDSLTIQDFQFRAAEGVWLRSNEANIQLEGGVTVQKRRSLYRLDGQFNAVRGTYNLKLLAITRAFEVTRGEVHYFGEPNLDADLDIEAKHVLQTAEAEGASRDIEVTAHITGSMRQPRLALDSNIRPPLSQSDLISLLVLRRTVNSQVGSTGQSAQAAQLASLLAQSLASELERALVSDAQTGPDIIEIRPGTSYGVAGQASLSRLSAGWQLGNRWFVSLSAGFCPEFQQFDYRNFGASLDYRLARFAKLSVSAEPYQTCLVGATSVATKRYQFGSDLRWERDY